MANFLTCISSTKFKHLSKTTHQQLLLSHPEPACAINSISNIDAVRPLLLFNCGNLNTVTGLEAGTARKLSSISNRDKRLFCLQMMQIETGFHKQFYSVGPGDKAVRRLRNSQQ